MVVIFLKIAKIREKITKRNFYGLVFLFPFSSSVLQGQKKRKEEAESLIECYTCGLETEDPEEDNVSHLDDISH